MAVVQGVKEKVHLPIYDSLTVKPEDQLSKELDSNTIKFFVDVQGKTKLETNLQAAGLLPHYNTFEARAMRVVISDLPPVFPSDPDKSVKIEDQDVVDEDGKPLEVWVNTTTPPTLGAGESAPTTGVANTVTAVPADVEFTLDDLIDQLRAAREDSENKVDIAVDDDSVTLSDTILSTLNGTTYHFSEHDVIEALANANATIRLYGTDLEDILDDPEQVAEDDRPLDEQIDGDGGSATLISKLIYNTVTSLYVGEKVMIEMPTWFFPAGAGIYSENGSFTTHGEPNPTATFRFAEPIYIDRQQNFRVEIVVPDSDTLKELQRIYGPLFIWVVLDGYMTRDVQ